MISVIIPAFNEEQTIGDVVRGALGALGSLGVAAEVIVVDDGSTDATARLARVAGAKVLRQPHAGKGLAVRSGLAGAKGETLVLMDADGQDLPAELPGMISAFRSSGADLLSGSRFLGVFRDAGISRLDSLGNRLLTMLANLLHGTRLTDLNGSFRILRKEAFRSVIWSCEGFEVESEMILRAARAGLKVIEVPVTRERRLGGVRKFRRWSDGLRILRAILKVRFSRNKPNKYGRSSQSP